MVVQLDQGLLLRPSPTVEELFRRELLVGVRGDFVRILLEKPLVYLRRHAVVRVTLGIVRGIDVDKKGIGIFPFTGLRMLD